MDSWVTIITVVTPVKVLRGPHGPGIFLLGLMAGAVQMLKYFQVPYPFVLINGCFPCWAVLKVNHTWAECNIFSRWSQKEDGRRHTHLQEEEKETSAAGPTWGTPSAWHIWKGHLLLIFYILLLLFELNCCCYYSYYCHCTCCCIRRVPAVTCHTSYLSPRQHLAASIRTTAVSLGWQIRRVTCGHIWQ